MKLPKLNIKGRTKWVVLSIVVPVGTTATMLFSSSGVAYAALKMCQYYGNNICLDTNSISSGAAVIGHSQSYVAFVQNYQNSCFNPTWDGLNNCYGTYKLSVQGHSSYCLALDSDPFDGLYYAWLDSCDGNYTLWSKCFNCDGINDDKWISDRASNDQSQFYLLSSDNGYGDRIRAVLDGTGGWYQKWIDTTV